MSCARGSVTTSRGCRNMKSVGPRSPRRAWPCSTVGSRAGWRAFPEVTAAIVERVMDRIDRLAATQAISQLNGVDRRLLSV
jgi:hypothetical protein